MAAKLQTERERGILWSRLLIALAFGRKKSFILAVVNFLKLETSYDLGGNSVHGR